MEGIPSAEWSKNHNYYTGGDTGVTVVIFSTGTELFVRLISEVDSLPMVAGRSEVVGVCASAMLKLFDTPMIETIIINVLMSEIRLTVFMPPFACLL